MQLGTHVALRKNIGEFADRKEGPGTNKTFLQVNIVLITSSLLTI